MHEQQLQRGLICPYCGQSRWKVLYTRRRERGRLQRRRECLHCEKRVTTWETIIGQPPVTNPGA